MLRWFLILKHLIREKKHESRTFFIGMCLLWWQKFGFGLWLSDGVRHSEHYRGSTCHLSLYIAIIPLISFLLTSLLLKVYMHVCEGVSATSTCVQVRRQTSIWILHGFWGFYCQVCTVNIFSGWAIFPDPDCGMLRFMSLKLNAVSVSFLLGVFPFGVSLYVTSYCNNYGVNSIYSKFKWLRLKNLRDLGRYCSLETQVWVICPIKIGSSRSRIWTYYSGVFVWK